MLNCTNCNAPLSKAAANSDSLVACGACGNLLRIDVFPAINRALPVGRTGATLQVDTEAGCFYHPRKKAIVPCATCGRFLCALCDVSLNGQHLCPICLEKGKLNQKIQNLENHRTCYDTIALLVATVSILVYWFTIFTAPIVIYLTVRHWKSPSSIIPRTKVRFILAFFIAGIQITGWILFFSKLVLAT
ncbi:MAG: hypothetical protein GY850_37450 [bacterium]|nr:hypothetical protein [bacterium]